MTNPVSFSYFILDVGYASPPTLDFVLRFFHFWHDEIQLIFSVLFLYHDSKLPSRFIAKFITVVFSSTRGWTVVFVLNTVTQRILFWQESYAVLVK
jgi:hypothetical protein